MMTLKFLLWHLFPLMEKEEKKIFIAVQKSLLEELSTNYFKTRDICYLRYTWISEVPLI